MTNSLQVPSYCYRKYFSNLEIKLRVSLSSRSSILTVTGLSKPGCIFHKLLKIQKLITKPMNNKDRDKPDIKIELKGPTLN